MKKKESMNLVDALKQSIADREKASGNKKKKMKKDSGKNMQVKLIKKGK
jgi:non-homologous end joining protein Ku